MRLINFDRVTGFFVPVFCERLVEIDIEFSCRIVGNVKQFDRLAAGIGFCGLRAAVSAAYEIY